VTLLSLWHKVDAETALRQANRKFRLRFQAMEQTAREQGRDLASLSDDDWDMLWKQAKHSVPFPGSVQ
jgi:uncharacterized protein YabN with tetrapyrrole methylase and pyrophosphatase domain